MFIQYQVVVPTGERELPRPEVKAVLIRALLRYLF